MSILTSGSVSRILKGEDVPKAIVQVLDYERENEYGYKILISDGDISSYVFLKEELDIMMTNKELEIFTIIQVNECVWRYVDGKTCIALADITVISYGADVGRTLGNPNFEAKSKDSTQETATNPNSTPISTIAGVSSKDSNSVLLELLTPDTVNRILNGEDVHGSFLQVLGLEKDILHKKYSVVISDGDICAFALLDSQLNSLITSKVLQTFCIIEIHKCVCINYKNSKFIRLLNLSVLVPATEVRTLLGNPINALKISSNATERAAKEPESTISQMVTSKKLDLGMFPKLTEGSIKRILNGEMIDADVVMQVLGYIKVTLDDDIEKYLYRLHISDGVHLYSFAVLHRKLHSLIIHNHLERFTIIRVDEWNCKKETPGRDMIITDLMILISGAEVGTILGSPENYASSPDDRDRVIHNNNQRSMLPKLTAGSIKWILNGDKVYAAVMQVLSCKKYNIHEDLVNERYQLLVSDGVVSYSFVTLDTKFNRLVFNRGLDDFTIIRVEKYCIQEVPDRKNVIVTDLVILTPGADVGKKLGHPVNYATSAASGTETGISGTHQRITLPKLTTGSIQWIYNGDDVLEPVVQVLNCKRMSGTESYWYEIFLFDGYHICPFAKLDTKLNSLVESKELERFAIMRVNKYIYNCVAGPRVIHLLDLTILTPGSDVGEKLKYF